MLVCDANGQIAVDDIKDAINQNKQEIYDIVAGVHDGATGQPGIDGATGIDGVSGIDGINGADGVPGVPGVDGVTGVDGLSSFVHIRYSPDGGLTFTGLNGTIPGDYMGTLTDNNSVASLSVLDYSWQLVRGDGGLDGLNGTDGLNGVDGIDGVNGFDGVRGAAQGQWAQDLGIQNEDNALPNVGAYFTFATTITAFMEGDSLILTNMNTDTGWTFIYRYDGTAWQKSTKLFVNGDAVVMGTLSADRLVANSISTAGLAGASGYTHWYSDTSGLNPTDRFRTNFTHNSNVGWMLSPVAGQPNADDINMYDILLKDVGRLTPFDKAIDVPAGAMMDDGVYIIENKSKLESTFVCTYTAHHAFWGNTSIDRDQVFTCMWMYDEDLMVPITFQMTDGTIQQTKEAFFRWGVCGEVVTKTIMWKVTIPGLASKKYSVRAVRSSKNGDDISNNAGGWVNAAVNGELMWFGAAV